jgi:hypothetical protein
MSRSTSPSARFSVTTPPNDNSCLGNAIARFCTENATSRPSPPIQSVSARDSSAACNGPCTSTLS